MQQLKLFTNMPRATKTELPQRFKNTRRAANGNIAGRYYSIPEEKEMALLFLDIRNFTPFVETHLAFDVIHMVKKLFYTFQQIIRANHGRVIETTGDGLYAAFGFDTDIKEAANAAIQTGLAILQNLEVLNQTYFRKNFNQKIDVGMGVHVGKVATGNIRLASEDHLIVMGYPVNIASRIEAATKELNNNFVISADTFKLLKNRPKKRPAIKINLKGVTGLFPVHLIGKPYEYEHSPKKPQKNRVSSRPIPKKKTQTHKR